MEAFTFTKNTTMLIAEGRFLRYFNDVIAFFYYYLFSPDAGGLWVFTREEQHRTPT